MKKYLAFSKLVLKSELHNMVNNLGTILSFIIHITVFSFLWDFVLEGKTLAGYSKKELIWYVILAEVVMYSFNYYYRKISAKVEMGDFAYDMSKPYNFLLRVIAEGIAELPITIVLMVIGVILGSIFAGPIGITIPMFIAVLAITLVAAMLSLTLQISIGLLSIWLGRDVTSVWLLVSKMMLIFAFTPVELFPKWIQIPLLLLPTTHVIYTPARLLVHYSKSVLLESIVYESLAFIVVSIMLAIIYKKGVKKQNVDGI